MSTQLVACLKQRKEEALGKVVCLEPVAEAEAEADRANRLSESWVFPSENGGNMDQDNFRKRVWVPLRTEAGLGTTGFTTCGTRMPR
jgi:hypothetical protein